MTFYELLIRADFLLAVGLLVAVPLALLLASVHVASVRDRLLVYWRASALLGITVYLWAGSEPMGFVTGWLARAVIPLALVRGDALMVLRTRPLPDSGTWRDGVFRIWRDATVAYSVVGLLYMLPLLGCTFDASGATCAAWFGPPQTFADVFHPDVERVWLGRYAWVALGIYSAYLLSTAVRLRRDLVERQA